jgi:hypothetical protein
MLVGLFLLISHKAAFCQMQPAIPTLPPPVPPFAASDLAGGSARLERGQAVVERPHAEYEPLGLHLGGFFLYPRAALDEVYNSNVFATKSGTRHDFITVVTPSFDLISNWSSHQLRLAAETSSGTYLGNPGENYLDYAARIDGRYDISRVLAARGLLGYRHGHEERDSVDATATALHPVEYDTYSARLALAQTGTRIGFETAFGFRRDEYADVASSTGGILNEQTRNVDNYAPSLQLDYRLAPGYATYLRSVGNFNHYDNSTGGDPTVPGRNSQGYRADVGARIELGELIDARVFIGYLEQLYDDPRLATVRGIDFGTRLAWNISEVTSLTLDIKREVQDSNSLSLSASGQTVNSPGYLHSTALLGIDEELRRDLLLRLELGYQNDNYKGIDRIDNRFDVATGLRWMIDRNLYIGGSLRFTHRDSSGSAAQGQFTRALTLIRFGAQL